MTGATGKVGSAAVQVLTGRSAQVRALVRDEQKAAALAHAGAELMIGDFGDASSLEQAVAGVATVVLVSPAHE